MFASSPPIEISELVPIRDLILEQTGMFFEEKKFYFIEKRVQKRMQATNSTSVREYYRLLKLGGGDEIGQLIEELTTNETYFYRNIPQLQSFAEEALQLLVEEKRKAGDYRLRIWSAACSSGEEPYTLVMLIKEHLHDFARWKLEVVGTDIDTKIIAKAQMATYDERSVKDVPPVVLNKYFENQGGRHRVRPEVTNLVQFHHLNLMDRYAMRRMQGFDFAFCRNVLIYFDEDSRKKVVNGIYDALNPGGFIFLGHSESVGKLSGAFKLVKFQKSLSYRK
ncbi:MAG: chemotaxis protein [Candidatus Lambdaproteobacteria bacterium RIFOXYD12_FULL_49_8]|uniref:Chemotaxis protein methyltransferase n=1 Tax=Candidatus Lambdaproteobacteria bacterium RIFOXYD2_FULL_50_16 TaxID=1817772 RepID=A0A1F6GB81_9PROT|nr:MAG: chemotaxis protein [Candidatus Lambdaproteobacteria bacterium RIFOXYD2_FULL_50_16]OGG98161.1 MAG: chemotaxis protein [Candidatus Lambdaproteobacteria bacterium RIFOXYD12_FULL_49_8]